MNKHLLVALTVLFVIPSAAQEVPMDYSYCGYHRSEQPIPSAKVVTYVQPSGQDDVQTLQTAIDWVCSQKPDKETGLRGAILLGEGTFTISEPLRIRTSGVILRGCGRDKTIIRKTGYDRGALIYIEGTHDIVTKDTFEVSDVKAGAITLPIASNTQLSANSRIIIHRPSTAAWIASLDCLSFGGGKRMGYWAWHPGDIDLQWNRQIMAVNGSDITIDAPITTTIENRWGGAQAIIYEHKGLIHECGVENMTLESDYNRDYQWTRTTAGMVSTWLMQKTAGCAW